MKTKIILFAIFILTSVTVPSIAQDYKVGLGLRLGVYSSGFTVKGFLSDRSALEGLATFGRRSFITTGLYEYHIPIKEATGFSLYLGGGGHLGLFGHDSRYRGKHHHDEDGIYEIDDGDTVVIPGLDFIFGGEYKFKEVPIAVGADIKPFVDFYSGPSPYFDAGTYVRFVF